MNKIYKTTAHPLGSNHYWGQELSPIMERGVYVHEGINPQGPFVLLHAFCKLDKPSAFCFTSKLTEGYTSEESTLATKKETEHYYKEVQKYNKYKKLNLI